MQSFSRDVSSQIQALLGGHQCSGGVRNVRVADPYREIPAIFRAANVVKGAFTDGEQQLWKKTKPGEADELVEPPGKDLATELALRRFENPIEVFPDDGRPAMTMLSEHRFRGTVAIQAMIHRAAFVLVVPGERTGLPARLVPTIPGTIFPKVSRADPFELVCWEFRWNNIRKDLRVEDVVAIPFAPDPRDIFGGVAPSDAASDSLDMAKAHTVYRRSAMANSGMQGFVSIDLGDPEANARGLTKDEATEVKRRLYEEGMGPNNAEKVHLLTGKASFTPVGPSSAREQQLRDGEKQTLEDIIRVTGVPPILMGVLDHSGRPAASPRSPGSEELPAPGFALAATRRPGQIGRSSCLPPTSTTGNRRTSCGFRVTPPPRTSGQPSSTA